MADVTVPVDVWHERAAARPPGLARYLADELLNATLRLVDGLGHLSVPIEAHVQSPQHLTASSPAQGP